MICATILSVVILTFIFFEYIFLKVLGLQYDTVGSLIFFFIIYVFLEVPLSLITRAIPRALKSLDILKTSKGWLSIILNTLLTFMLIELIDEFMDTIFISWQGVMIFALITTLINRMLEDDNEEPPMVDSKEFKEIGEKFTSKK